MQQPEIQPFVCPECGNFASELIEETGWCESCSAPHLTIIVVRTVYIRCERCGRNNTNDLTHRLCRSCRTAVWLERNADEIEQLMSIASMSSHSAIKAIVTRNSALNNCALCGDSIRSTAVFCKRPRCVKAARHMKYLMYESREHYSRDDALVLVKEKYTNATAD